MKKRFHEKNNQKFNATFVKKTLPNDDFELEKKKNEKRLHQGSTPKDQRGFKCLNLREANLIKN